MGREDLCVFQGVEQHPWPLPPECQDHLPIPIVTKMSPDTAKRPLGATPPTSCSEPLSWAKRSWMRDIVVKFIPLPTSL